MTTTTDKMKALIAQATQRMALAVLITACSSASAFYNPHVGKWINRDPIGEEGGNNLSAFTGNNAINHIDAFGNVKFEGCEGKEDQIKSGFENFCKKLDDPAFNCCLNHFNIPGKLKWMCDNRDTLTVKCEADNTGSCKDACGWSLPGGQTIHVCPTQWNNAGCGDVGCTLLHEMTHVIGHPLEKWPQKVEKCLGCGGQ